MLGVLWARSQIGFAGGLDGGVGRDAGPRSSDAEQARPPSPPSYEVPNSLC